MTPMITADNAMMMIVIISTFLRPTRSAMRPKMMPPSGRTKKPTAKTPKVASSAEVGSDLSKKAAAMNGANTA